MPAYLYSMNVAVLIDAEDGSQAQELALKTQRRLYQFDAVETISEPTLVKESEDDGVMGKRIKDLLSKDLDSFGVKEVRLFHPNGLEWSLYFSFTNRDMDQRVALTSLLVESEIYDFHFVPENVAPQGTLLWKKSA